MCALWCFFFPISIRGSDSGGRALHRRDLFRRPPRSNYVSNPTAKPLLGGYGLCAEVLCLPPRSLRRTASSYESGRPRCTVPLVVLAISVPLRGFLEGWNRRRSKSPLELTNVITGCLALTRPHYRFLSVSKVLYRHRPRVAMELQSDGERRALVPQVSGFGTSRFSQEVFIGRLRRSFRPTVGCPPSVRRVATRHFHRKRVYLAHHDARAA
jgi:hypothetical protein